MEGGILKCCRVSKQRKGFLEGDTGMGSGSADGNMDRRERMAQNKKQNAKGV